MTNAISVKVSYDPATKLVTGYYPSFENYQNIPTPNITISQDDWMLAIQSHCNVVKDDLSGLVAYVQSDADKIAALKNELIAMRQIYLRASSSYYAPDFPSDVLTKRTAARSEITQITNTASLADLQNFSTDYSTNFN